MARRSPSRRPDHGPVELQDLRQRLQQAGQTVGAIRSGAVDAAAVSLEHGDSGHSLNGADRTFWLLIEAMHEAALTVSASGIILYANPRLTELLVAPVETLVGSKLTDWVQARDIPAIKTLLAEIHPEPGRHEMRLRSAEGTSIPVYLSVTRISLEDGSTVIGLVAADLSEQYERASVLERSEKHNRDLLQASDASRRTLLSMAEDQLHAQESLGLRNVEISRLYDLSRELATIHSLDQVIQIVARHAVEDLHVTFARLALLEEDELVIRGAHPVRLVRHDLQVGSRHPLSLLPHVQMALQKAQPAVLNASDPELTETERRALLFDAASSVLVVPMQVGSGETGVSRVLGILLISEARSPQREPLSDDKIRLAQSIADQAAAAILRMSLHEQTDRRLSHLVALRTIDTAISGSFDLRTVITVLLEQATIQLGADAASLLLLDASNYTLEHFASRGFRTESARHARIRLGEGPTGRAALQRRPIRIPDLRSADEDLSALAHLQGEEFVSYFAIPISVKAQTRGLLEILHRHPLRPDQEWFDFLDTMGNQAALAIENAELFRNLDSANVELSLAYDATIEGWSRALDLRDRETEGHTQRVAELAIRLWRQCGGADSELRHIRWGALLHDIGKMGVPDGILLKPGPLTDDEWRIMKQHPSLAHDMLAPIHYLRHALDIPYCHHEKWDGSGYPRGLQGENIPKAARVFAIVDVWDALTSDRPYRPAWSREKALEHIREQSGTHFDPAVVSAFMALNK